ncbi:tetratricopeptide repeat protein [Lutibacter citreus]|uniref:tetratricopeptide repeat protein n=1 Tax=Lutibacter citreus TaxID=2138210 RepID=UPI000DBE67FE|nr:tetratricopeptide repeat protein [Lutibacter citreus]
MRLKLLLSIFSFYLISCSSPTNSPKFINAVTGKYLYNSDETLEVFFIENDMFLKWRGATKIKPLIINENTFFIKEMNEKIQFSINYETEENYIILVPKKENDSIKFKFRKLKKDEKIPNDFLKEGNFNKALEGYLTIQKNDSLDKSVSEKNFNKLGYRALNNNNFTKALGIFKINMKLHPNSSNVYDSYADALKKSGDTIKAIEYYKKSLAIDSGNKRAKKFINKYSITTK